MAPVRKQVETSSIGHLRLNCIAINVASKSMPSLLKAEISGKKANAVEYFFSPIAMVNWRGFSDSLCLPRR